jgi:hypothetical protein
VATQTEQTPGGRVVQSWMPVALAAELKQRAEAERRSVSALVRLCVEDQLQDRRP